MGLPHVDFSSEAACSNATVIILFNVKRDPATESHGI